MIETDNGDGYVLFRAAISRTNTRDRRMRHAFGQPSCYLADADGGLGQAQFPGGPDRRFAAHDGRSSSIWRKFIFLP
jgi:hypothetical protein